MNKLEGNEYNPQEELWEIKIDELTETLNKHTEVPLNQLEINFILLCVLIKFV